MSFRESLHELVVAQGFSLGFDFFHAVVSLNCANRVRVPVTGDTN